MPLLASWLGIVSPTKKLDKYPRSSHDSLTIIEKADIVQSQKADAREKKLQQLVRSIVDTHTELITLPHLRPAPAINKLLGNLVSICSEIHDQEIVDKVLRNVSVQAVLPSLRQICARSESCLELHWAEHILEGQTEQEVVERLESFPYYENYEDLTRLEVCSILSATKVAPRRVAFIGSGPLPLTSLCLLQALKHDAAVRSLTWSATASTAATDNAANEDPVVLNVDYDESAISASLKLSLALGERGKGMEFICAEATSASASRDLAEFDVVYMAALVGITQAEKEKIMLEVVARMRRGALLVIRSSWGLRTCLYPEVDFATETLLKRLEPCVAVHPYNQVVNSVIVARVR
ncbi:putative nicotianamine synthase [Triangularia verruculosa]|uniref:Nicotianamine synthase n=1 Tax=Triangularia verruculosa TaxID=2587418 RepID=A0AAN6XIW4_9PEZI|nr:putative nicotianamine synthase [Triangularia verruculosa]